MNVYQILQTPDMTDRDDIRHAALTPNPVARTLAAAKLYCLRETNAARAADDRDREADGEGAALVGPAEFLSWEKHDGEAHDLPCWIAIDDETGLAFEIVEVPLL